MMKRVLRNAVITTCLLTAWQAAAGQDLALAQSGGQAPGSTASPPAQPVSVATFIEMARAGNAFEIETSRLALEKATQPALKNFARTMIDDHTRADQKLVSVARGIGQSPGDKVTMEPRQRQQLESLSAASGPDFDRLYASAQLEAHQRTVQLFQTYAEQGTNERLRQFARETLPTLQGHLDQIQKMNR